MMGRSYFRAKAKSRSSCAGHSHDRARAVGHQHIVRDPDRDARLIDRVDGIRAGEHAGLFLVHRFALDIRLTRGLLPCRLRPRLSVQAW